MELMTECRSGPRAAPASGKHVLLGFVLDSRDVRSACGTRARAWRPVRNAADRRWAAPLRDDRGAGVLHGRRVLRAAARRLPGFRAWRVLVAAHTARQFCFFPNPEAVRYASTTTGPLTQSGSLEDGACLDFSCGSAQLALLSPRTLSGNDDRTSCLQWLVPCVGSGHCRGRTADDLAVRAMGHALARSLLPRATQGP